MRKDAAEMSFEKVILLGNPVLFNEFRILPETVPEGLWLYEIRHTVDDWGNPCEVGRLIGVNFYGSILTSDPIQLDPDGHLPIQPGDFSPAGISRLSMETYLAEYPPVSRDIMKLSVLPAVEWPLLFTRSESEDRVNRCVGHIRGDFGYDQAFITNWQPHLRGTLDTPRFQTDLNRVMEWLRHENAPLNSLAAMEYFCRFNEDAQVTTEPWMVFGFCVETEQYRFMLRCAPIRIRHHLYLYCYQK